MAEQKLSSIARVLRVVGRPDDGWGGASVLARRLGVDPGRVQRWARRGWVTPKYCSPVAGLCGGFVSADELLLDAARGDRRGAVR